MVDGEILVLRDDHCARFRSPRANQMIRAFSSGGFIVSRMPDPHGNPILVAQYFLTADGPQKVGEKETELRESNSERRTPSR